MNFGRDFVDESHPIWLCKVNETGQFPALTGAEEDKRTTLSRS
jgi:hypothetical protein